MKNAILFVYLQFDSSAQIVWSLQPFQRCCCRCYRPWRLIRIELKALASAAFYYWLDIFLSFSFCSFLALFNQLNRLFMITSSKLKAKLDLISCTCLDSHFIRLCIGWRWSAWWMNLLFHSKLFFFLVVFVSLKMNRKFKLIEFSFVSCFITQTFMARINVFMHQRWTQFEWVSGLCFNCFLQFCDCPINLLESFSFIEFFCVFFLLDIFILTSRSFHPLDRCHKQFATLAILNEFEQIRPKFICLFFVWLCQFSIPLLFHFFLYTHIAITWNLPFSLNGP